MLITPQRICLFYKLVNTDVKGRSRSLVSCSGKEESKRMIGLFKVHKDKSDYLFTLTETGEKLIKCCSYRNTDLNFAF